MIPTNIIKIKDKIKKSITLSKRESKLFNVYVDRITGKNACEEEPEPLDNETLELIKELRKTETKQYMIDIFDYEIMRLGGQKVKKTCDNCAKEFNKGFGVIYKDFFYTNLEFYFCSESCKEEHKGNDEYLKEFKINSEVRK